AFDDDGYDLYLNHVLVSKKATAGKGFRTISGILNDGGVDLQLYELTCMVSEVEHGGPAAMKAAIRNFLASRCDVRGTADLNDPASALLHTMQDWNVVRKKFVAGSGGDSVETCLEKLRSLKLYSRIGDGEGTTSPMKK